MVYALALATDCNFLDTLGQEPGDLEIPTAGRLDRLVVILWVDWFVVYSLYQRETDQGCHPGSIPAIISVSAD